MPNINWNKDRYLNKFYILQEEFIGTPLRINFIDGEFLVFNFESSKLDINKTKNLLSNLKNDIVKIVKHFEIQGWISKFDVILNESNEYAFLDIGIDPPMRLLKI